VNHVTAGLGISDRRACRALVGPIPKFAGEWLQQELNGKLREAMRFEGTKPACHLLES